MMMIIIKIRNSLLKRIIKFCTYLASAKTLIRGQLSSASVLLFFFFKKSIIFITLSKGITQMDPCGGETLKD